MSEYEDIVLGARQKDIQDVSRAVRKQLASDYITLIDQVLNNPDNYQDPEQLQQALVRALVKYSDRANLTVREGIREAAKRATGAHQEALEQLYDGITGNFGTIPERTIRLMYIRRDMGLIESFKTLNRFSMEASAKEVGDILTSHLQSGTSYQDAVNRIASAMVRGNKEAEEVLENYGLMGGRRYLRVDPDPEAQELARNIGFNARRIALTEINTAYHESSRQAASKSPVVKAVRWTLSAAHPEPDICDVYAEADLHGLGKGLYHPDSAPMKPHPFCLCSYGYEMKEPDEDNPDVPEPETVDATEISKHIPNGSANQIRRVRRTINRHLTRAKEVATEDR